MSRSTDDDSTEPGEFGLRQFPYSRERPSVTEPQLREQYGWVRAYYKARPDRYTDIQTWLNRARYGVSYDVYLARSAAYAIGAAIGGVLLGVGLTWLLTATGVIAGIRNPFDFRGDVVFYLARHRTLFAGAALVIVLAAVSAIGTWYLRYNYPRIEAGARRRNIDVTLPHAITFMYALSRGGMDLLEILEVLSDNEGTYGEVANECEMIVREVEFFGNDLYTALRNARNITPSENFQRFLDDMLGVLDSGGDLSVFLEDEAGEYLDEARDEQGQFLETLAVLSEFFITLFVATPLFLIVILVVMSLLGSQTLAQLTLIVYAMLPLGMAGFLVLLDTLSEPYEQPSVRFDQPTTDVESGFALVVAVVRDVVPGLQPVAPGAVGSPGGRQRAGRYLRHRRRRALLARLKNPLVAVRVRPAWVLVLSVPAGVLAALGAIAADLATPTADAMLAAPIPTTTWLVAVPALVALVPLSYFHERKRARERHFARRFPDTLSVLASANKMGIQFVDALKLVSRWASGPMAAEMNQLRNDLRWNHDTRRSLRGLADRIGVPQLSRTMTLVSEGLRSSTDVAAVLDIAARDTRERAKLDRERRQELAPYLAVVIIGFLVFLLVVVLLDSAYLTPITEAQQQARATPTTGRSLPISLTSAPVEAYRTLFFHAALIQAMGSGLLAGKLAEGDTLAGLKYGIALVVLAIAVFTIL